jgi:hypothetical protein
LSGDLNGLERVAAERRRLDESRKRFEASLVLAGASVRAIGRAAGISNQRVHQLLQAIEERRADPVFQARLRRLIEANREGPDRCLAGASRESQRHIAVAAHPAAEASRYDPLTDP